MAKVSTIVAVYNGAATIDRALRSVFAQTFTDNEIVVVNDGSTDDTASVLAQYGDRIRVVTQPNRGLSGRAQRRHPRVERRVRRVPRR